MNGRDLLMNPCWQGKDLGYPLPDSPHAVSVALPRWEDVIAYEQNNPICRNALKTIYPRFGIHPLLRELTKNLTANGYSAWPYPSDAAAQAARKHCLRQVPEAKTRLVSKAGLTCLLTDKKATPHAKNFWQHTGLGASSRQAAIALGKELAPPSAEGFIARCLIKERLASLHGCSSEEIILLPAGMAGLHTALQAIQVLNPGKPTLQLGFPYVDILKQPQVIFNGSELLQTNNLSEIAITMDRLNPAAVIVEIPSNPLLKSVNLPKVSELAHTRGIKVIADDTIGTAININILSHADLIFTSLTKSFAGRGDIMAGSLLVSPKSPWSRTLLSAISPLAELSDADAIALEQASFDVSERVRKLDKNCLELAQKLASHNSVEIVLHPKNCPNFKALMRPGGGYGCLLSIKLKGEVTKASQFYNSLRVSKGPSLGTNFTLVCPYTLLAHYEELAWAADCGVPAHLLRVSVGLEDPQELWDRFDQALRE